jgi:hypothetical protein
MAMVDLPRCRVPSLLPIDTQYNLDNLPDSWADRKRSRNQLVIHHSLANGKVQKSKIKEKKRNSSQRKSTNIFLQNQSINQAINRSADR